MTQDPVIILVTIDYTAGTTTLIRSDGKEAVIETDFTTSPGSAVHQVQYSPRMRGVLMRTTQGDEAVLPLTTRSDPVTAPDIPVVYLDQNQWSFISTIESGNAMSSPQEDEAARQLIAWVKDRRIILPISSGHMVETTQWTDHNRRYQLGLTLTRLSQGWQMRHPLDVESDELATALTTPPSAPLDNPSIFGRHPAAMDSSRDAAGYEPSPDLPPEAAELVEALVHTTTAFDVLTDGEPIERARTATWREAQQGFSDWLAENGDGAEQKREAIRLFFLGDLQHAISLSAADSDLSPEQTEAAVTTNLLPNLARLPYLGLRLEFLTGKHLNHTTWEDNDLIDKMYLCLAAGYADAVICERSAASHIRQAQQRLGRPQTAFRKFSGAVDMLERMTRRGEG